MKISLGFSTCPNDTFMFDALVNRRIDTHGIEFKTTMADIKELNDMAFNSELDVTKLSYHAYGHLRDEYVLLNAGSALGHNCGPLVISRKPISPDQILGKSVAIPGKYTTANLLFSIAYPKITEKQVRLFHEIEDAVLNEEVDLGLIIHENRFTYQEKGLHKVLDLGEYWEDRYHYPIPLGGIVAKRSLGIERIKILSKLVSQSVQYAFDHPKDSMPFILKHAQEMQAEVVNQHISLYVNNYSVSLGKIGKAAVEKLYAIGIEKELFSASNQSIFIS